MATIGNSGSAITLSPGLTTIAGTVTGSAPAYAGFYAAVYGPGPQHDDVVITGAVENTTGGRLDAGIVLGAPGEVINQGLISGGAGLVIAGYGADSYIRNANVITAAAGNGITTYGEASLNNAAAIRATGTGVDLRGGGIINNEGTITGAIGVQLAAYYGTGSINNFGLIRGTLGDGAILAGSLTNHSGATIAGSTAGLYLYTSGNANNAGAITGGSIGIALGNFNSAAVTIATTIENTGVIKGGATGIALSGSIAALVDIYNLGHGSIIGKVGIDVYNAKGPIVRLGNNGLIKGGVTLHYGAINNTGSIYGVTTAANLEAGYVLNSDNIIGGQTGIISAGTSFITSLVSGSLTKYSVFGAFTLTNAGYIGGGAIAVDLLTGGVIRNNGGDIISAGTAIVSGPGPGLRLINRGRIDGTAAGVAVNGSGYIYNAGKIIAGGNAVSLSGSLVMYNYGLIQSTSAAAIAAAAAGTGIYNYGTIAGGLTTAAGSYLYNTGTIIAGATAGLALGGTVTGHGGVIALGAAPATIAGGISGGQKIAFTGVGQTLDLTNPTAFKARINDFTLADTIDLTTIPLANITGDTFSAGTLTLFETSGSLKLAFANPASLATATFALFTDGLGTGITLTRAAPAPANNHARASGDLPEPIHPAANGWLTPNLTHPAAPFIPITL